MHISFFFKVKVYRTAIFPARCGDARVGWRCVMKYWAHLPPETA